MLRNDENASHPVAGARWLQELGPPVSRTDVEERSAEHIGAFGITLGQINRRRGRQKGDHLNGGPHAGVRVAGD